MRRRLVFPGVWMLSTLICVAMQPSAEESITQGIAAFRQGNYDTAVSLFTRALEGELGESTRANVLYNRAMAYRTKGNFTAAVEDLDAAIELEPSTAPYIAARATLRASMGDTEAALRDFSMVLAINPANAIAYYHRGNLYAEIGKSEQALKDYREAAQLEPGLPQVHIQIGRTLAKLERFDEAVRAFELAVEINPESTLAMHSRAALFILMGRYEEALQDLDNILRVEPNNAGAHQNRGLVLAAQEKHAQAIAEFDIAIVLLPDNAGAYLNRGNARAALGRLQEALADLDTALRLDPTNPRALSNRATLLEAMGQGDRAMQDLDRLVGTDPEALESYRRRGFSRFQAGDFPGASEDFTEYNQRKSRDLDGILWAYIAAARAGGNVERALHGLERADLPKEAWTGLLIRMFRGDRKPAGVLESAASISEEATRTRRLCEAHYYVAQYNLIHGKPYEAKISLEEVVAATCEDLREHAAARAELGRLPD